MVTPQFFPHRLSLNKSRLLMRAARGFLGKPLTKTPDSAPRSQSSDYIQLVSAPDPRPRPHAQRRGHPPLRLRKGKKTWTSLPTQQRSGGVCPGPRRGWRRAAKTQRQRRSPSLQSAVLASKIPGDLASYSTTHVCLFFNT